LVDIVQLYYNTRYKKVAKRILKLYVSTSVLLHKVVCRLHVSTNT